MTQTVTMPNGDTLEFPDDTNPSVMEAFVKSHAVNNPVKADANLGGTMRFGPWNTNIPLSPSVEAGIIGAGKTASRMMQGIQQMLPGSNTALDAQAKGEDAAYKPLADAHPVATTVGEAAPYLAAAAVGPLASPLAMAGMSATEYGTPVERAERAALTYAGGKVGQGIARVLGGPASRAGVPTGPASNFFDYAAGNKWGIPTTTGMNGNKTAALAESVIANMPFVNGSVNAARTDAFQQFNRAVSNTFGQDATQLTPTLLGTAQERIGKTIGALAERNTLVGDQAFNAGLDGIRTRISRELVGDHAALAAKWVENVEKAIQPVVTQTGVVNTIPGVTYKALQSDIGGAAKGAQGTVSNVLGDLRDVLRSGMDRSISPADSAAWKTANRQYFNLQQAANAVKSSPEGNLSPLKLLGEINRSQRAAKFGGGNDLAELGQWAASRLPDKIPNSGTAQRELMQRILTNPVTGMAELGGLGYVADKTDHPYAAGTIGLLAPFIAGRAFAGKPVSDLTRQLLMRGGGLLGYESGR